MGLLRHKSPSVTSISFFLFQNSFIHLFLAVLGLRCFRGFSTVVGSRGHSPVAVCKPLIAVASLVAAHGL